MRRLAVLVLVLFAMLWQSVSMARVGATLNPRSDLAHLTLHLQGQSHHHHEDGSYHLDDSSESKQHMATDHQGASMVMEASSAHGVYSPRSAAPGGLHDTVAPDPTLDGLLRPPRLSP